MKVVLNFCQLWLTCKDEAEADKVANTLLVKHLVACVRQIPTGSRYWWQDKLEDSEEVILQMESRLDLFEEIEKEVGKLHSYEAFVLEATPIEKISKNAAQWLEKSTNG